MLKKLFATFAIALAVFATNGVYGSISPVSAERVYASTYNGLDYYILTEKISGTRSGMTYVMVATSNGGYYTWCFDSYKYWKYRYWMGGVGNHSSQKTPWRPVSESQLANDILYITLQYKAMMH